MATRSIRMDPVQHFEIPYKSRDRAKKFYFDAFGWQVFDLPGSPYSLANSVDTHANGMPKRAGAINGGLVPRSDLVQGPTFMVKVGNVAAHLERIREHGGDVLTEPVHMGPVIFSRIRDTEGNVIAIMQDAPESKGGPQKAGAAGAAVKATAETAKKAKTTARKAAGKAKAAPKRGKAMKARKSAKRGR
jgi:predicted enzyme related to lactoylglutathione lyase